jgi:CRP-like cAMP-binding protein
MALVALKTLAFFDGLSLTELEILSPYFKRQSFKAGQVVFWQNASAEYLYLVTKGSVIIRYKPEDGPPMKVTQVQTGGVFGWSAAMGNVTYTSGAECVEDCETFKMRGIDIRKLSNKYPDLGEKILDRLAAIISERWQNRQPQVLSILSQGISQSMSEKKTLKEKKPMEANDQKLKEEQMKALVEQLSAYIEHFHGGSVDYVSFNGKELQVKLGGSCLGCPLSPATLHGWVEGTVRQFFPDIENVVAI